MTTKTPLVYILSPSFSGSTLLTLMIGEHDEIATIGELKATAMFDIDQYHCSCGELIGDCGFFTELRERLEKAGAPLDLSSFGTHFDNDAWWGRVLRAQVKGGGFETVRRLALRTWPPLRRHFNAVMERNRLIVEQVLAIQGGSVFMDGSKDPHRALYLADSGLFDVRIIHLVRDGRAQSNSRRRGGDVTWEQAVQEWLKTIGQMDEVCARLPSDHVMSIRYENLCADPAGVMREVWQFLGLPELERDWHDANLGHSRHHVLGNYMRKQSTIHISLDEKWREAVTDDDQVAFDRLAGSRNRGFGYA